MAEETLKLSIAERQEITLPAENILMTARSCAVVDDTTYGHAGESLKEIKAAQKKLEAKKRSLLDPVNATLRAIRELFQEPERELSEAEGLYKRAMLGYSDAQERKRAEEQRVRDEAARQVRERLEREARERDARAAEHRQAGKEGFAALQEQKADQLRDQAASVVPVIVQREAPRVSGVVERENWYAVVGDKAALCAAIANGEVPLTAFEPNMKFLNNQAKAMKRDLRYPGVTACVDRIMAAAASK